MDVDFTLIASQIRVGGKRHFHCIVVHVIDDQTTENDEEFQLQLHLNNNTLEARQFMLSPERATIFILDNDSKEGLLLEKYLLSVII